MLGCLKRLMGIGEIHVTVAGQLDCPNDEFSIVDFDLIRSGACSQLAAI
jgi:hypothetical protein